MNVKLSPPSTLRACDGATAVIVQTTDSGLRPDVGMYPRVA